MTGALGVMAAAALGLPGGWSGTWVARRFGAEGLSAWAMAGVCAVVFGWGAFSTAGAGPVVPTMSLILGWTLLTLAAIDMRVLRLPDPLTLPLMLAGLATTVFLPGAPVGDHAIGVAAGYGVLAGIGWAFWRWRGRDGLGLGDAKLLGAAGAWLGWRPLPLVTLIACGTALAWIALRIVSRGRGSLRQPMAFGAPLCLATWLVWLYGTRAP